MPDLSPVPEPSPVPETSSRSTLPPLRAVLDASAIIGAGYGRSYAFRRLLHDVRAGDVKLVVPELAILETVAVLGRYLRNARKSLTGANALFKAGGVSLPVEAEVVAACEKFLRGALKDAGVETPASYAAHDELVKRILEHRKPTKPAGRDKNEKELSDQPEDYRDQLLWSMVRDQASKSPLVFITANTNDFADTDKKVDEAGFAELHEQLQEDLVKVGDDGNVVMMVSVHQFVDAISSEIDSDFYPERSSSTCSSKM